MIENIRKSFVALAQHKNDRFHPDDVQRVKTDDWTIQRYVLGNKSEEAALQALVKVMEWRKSFAVNDFTEDYFPEEIYKIGSFYVQGKDKDGRQLFWHRISRHYKTTDFALLVRQFMVYNFERLDQNTKNQGWAMVIDASGSGISNMDLEFGQFMINVIRYYYQRGPKYVCVVDMPWILNTTANLLVAFLSEEMRNATKFLKRQELSQYLEISDIPAHLNGSYAKELSVIPKGVKPLEQLTHTKFSSEQIKKIRKTYKEWLN